VPLASTLRFIKTAASSLAVFAAFSAMQLALADPADAIFVNGIVETINPALDRKSVV